MLLYSRTFRRLTYCAVVLFTVTPCSGMKAQQPVGVEQTVLRAWGDHAMHNVMLAWESKFRAEHPHIRFQNTLLGSGSGMAGIITGTAEFAIMGRPASANEIMGFEWVHRYKPREISVLTGSVDRAEGSPALVVFVHRANPVHQLTLQQLRRALGCCEKSTKIATWGGLGAEGAWRSRPIHAYLYNSETGTGSFLQKAILGNGDKWDWSCVHEYGDFHSPTSIAKMDFAIMSAFARDPDAIAISTLRYAGPDAIPVAIAQQDEGPFIIPNERTIRSREYQLARTIYIYVDAAPTKPINPLVREFLLFVLHPQSQRLADRSGSFLALPESLTASEARELTP